MILKKSSLLFLALLFGLRGTARAADTCRQAESVSGSVSWQLLGQTRLAEQRTEGAWQSAPDCVVPTKPNSELWMQIHASLPVPYQREPLLLEAQLELVKSDPDGIVYRLNDAHQIH